MKAFHHFCMIENMRKKRHEQDENAGADSAVSTHLTRADVNSICRYWVESRMSQLLNNDALLTRSGLSIEVKQNHSTGLMSWFFKVNDRNVASVDSNGFIWCSNLVVNGIDFVRMVKNIITTNKEIDNLGTIYVKHEDLHDGNYSLDVKDVKTKDLVVENDGERHDTIELKAAHDSGFITFDSFYPWLELGLNTHKNMLQLSDLMNTTEMRINCVKAGQYADAAVFVFGKDDSRGNAFQMSYFHVADDSENNHLELSAYDYANHFLEIHRNLIETCLPNINLFSDNDDMTVKIGARDARGRNLMIYYDNMLSTSDCHAVVGLQGCPALTFRTDQLEVLMNLLVSTNLINQLVSTLAAGGEVGFIFGKANSIYSSGVLSYHLDSTLANSYIELKVNGMSGLRVFADRVESITPFTCPNIDDAHIAYTNQPNTFTQPQIINADLYVNARLRANNFNVFNMPTSWDSSKTLWENLNMSGFGYTSPCIRTIQNFPANYYVGMFVGGGSGRSFIMTVSKIYEYDDIRIYFNQADDQQDFHYTNTNNYSRLLTHRNFNTLIPNVAYRNLANTFTANQTINGELFINASDYEGMRILSAANESVSLTIGANSSSKNYAEIMFVYMGNGSTNNYLSLWNTDHIIKCFSSKCEILKPLTISTPEDATWNYVLSMVNPNLTEGHHTTFGFGKSIAGSTSAEIAYEYSDTEANRRIKIGFYSTNINSTWIYPAKTEFNRKVVINSPGVVDCLEVYNSTANSNAYLWVGNSGADNENRGTFGWVGNATAANRFIAAWCRGVEIQRWYQTITQIKKPLEVYGQTTIYPYDASNDVAGLRVLNTGQATGKWTGIQFGKNTSTGNTASIRFIYQGDNNANNRIDFNHWGITNPLSIYRNKITVNNGPLYINSTDAFNVSSWNMSLRIIDANARSGTSKPTIAIGKAETTRECALIHYEHSGTTASDENYLSIGHWGPTENINIYGNRTEFVYKVETRQTTPANAFGDNMKANILKLMYPVGSVYQNATDSRNPNEILGANIGTWTQIQGYYLYANPTGATTGPNGGYGGDINHQHRFGFRYCGFFTAMRGLNKGDTIEYLDGDGSWAQAVHNGSTSVANDGHSGGDNSGYVYQQTTRTTSSGSFPPYYRVWTWYRSQ